MRLPALSSGSPNGARWAMSFADLCLVMLAFLLLLQAHRGDPAVLGASIRSAFGAPSMPSLDEQAAPLFQPGEALLLDDARAHFTALGREAAARRYLVHVESIGTDGHAQRFDAWELSAARAAAIARAIQSGGLDAGRIDLSIDGTGPAAATRGQHVRVTMVAHKD
jgi:flagellar motor protein MotB